MLSVELTYPCRCLIVKTDGYSPEAQGKVIQMRANIEGIKLGSDVLPHLAEQSDSSLRCVSFIHARIKDNPLILPFRYNLQLLTPAAILANLAGRQAIDVADIKEMSELFLNAKASAEQMEQWGDK